MNLLYKILFFSALISLYACSKKTSVTNISESHIIINNPNIDSAIYKVMSPYKKTHDEQMYAVIAKSEDALVKDDIESTLGNFFCDAVIYETKKLLGKDSTMLDVAIFNKGGLRNSLPKGNITLNNSSIIDYQKFNMDYIINNYLLNVIESLYKKNKNIFKSEEKVLIKTQKNSFCEKLDESQILKNYENISNKEEYKKQVFQQIKMDDINTIENYLYIGNFSHDIIYLC